ncbi:MAG: hypothetical protein M3Z35_03540, partial [Nitrospirota bacterium]|nr:hypothetical protein [Nitrospirota bacterium]
MSEETDVIEALEEAGVVALFNWVGRVAFERVFRDFDEDAGHDQAIVGSLAYKYLLNLFDRATSSGKYTLPDGSSPEDGRDLLRLGITDQAFADMPRFDRDSINRSNFNGSPGWATPEIRWLLQSFKFSGIDKIAWSDKSPTKQRVAGLPHVE